MLPFWCAKSRDNKEKLQTVQFASRKSFPHDNQGKSFIVKAFFIALMSFDGMLATAKEFFCVNKWVEMAQFNVSRTIVQLKFWAFPSWKRSLNGHNQSVCKPSTRIVKMQFSKAQFVSRAFVNIKSDPNDNLMGLQKWELRKRPPNWSLPFVGSMARQPSEKSTSSYQVSFFENEKLEFVPNHMSCTWSFSCWKREMSAYRSAALKGAKGAKKTSNLRPE